MKILIVDNGTSYLKQLQKLAGDSSEVIPYVQLQEKGSGYFDLFDAVVLSGGHSFPVLGNEHRLETELSLIKNLQKPIFGICYGFELIANAFGETLVPMKGSEKGVIAIEVIQPDIIFNGVHHFKVFENHRFVLAEPLTHVLALAKSKDGIEAIKHKTLPIYGVQFHPEMFVTETEGDDIFQNFLNTIV